MLNWIKRFWTPQARTQTQRGWNGFPLPESTFAGVHIDQEKALGLSAVWCAVRVISEAVASLPLVLYRRLPEGGKERANEHPLYTLLHDSPNPEQTPFVFREYLQSQVLLWGSAYAEIVRDGVGNPVELWPIPSAAVEAKRDGSGRVVFLVGRDKIPLSPDDVLHVPGLLGPDATTGYSPIRLARESLGLTLACERFGASFFGNAARPSGTLETAGQLSDNARENLRTSFERAFTGEGKTGRVVLLEDGLHFNPHSVPPEDGQFLQSRQFQVVEVARWFNLQPHKLKSLERGTWSNLQTENQAFVDDTLRPWLLKWEQEISRKLLGPDERDEYFVETLMDALLRGDTLSRYQAYEIGLRNKWLLVNEVRELENLNPIEEPKPEPVPVALVPQPQDPTQDPAQDPTQENNGQPAAESL